MPDCPYGKILYKVMPQDTLWKLAQRYDTSVEAILALNPGLQPRRMPVGQLVCISPGVPVTPQPPQPKGEKPCAAGTALSDALRMLWEQHVYWTRMAIVSAVQHLPDERVVSERLLRNAADFEMALRPIYGAEVAQRFGDLLEQHLVLASQLVGAAQAGDQNAAANIEARWYANAAAIAAFLGSINPHWSAADWNAMLQQHLAMTKAEAVLLLTQKYPESIQLFDEIERQALGMADMMTEGIRRQFAGRF